MKSVNAYFRAHSDSVIKGMIIITGIALPGAILCYFFPAVQVYFFLLWRILLIIGLIVICVLFLAWQILGARNKKSRLALPARKATIDFYRAIAEFSDDEFEKFCNKINDPAIRGAIKGDRELRGNSEAIK